MIVVVSHAGDDHAPPVLRSLRSGGARAVQVDLSDLPLQADVEVRYGGRGTGAEVRTSAGKVPARAITAVWWRRPLPFEVGPGLTWDEAAFAFRQVKEAIAGLAASLDARWVNDPWSDARASHKLFQLDRAARLGLAVPPTLVTNDPDRARAFVRSPRRRAIVHKALHSTPEDWRPTRLLDPDDDACLARVRRAPLVLQEYVPGVDVRVTVVGGRVFAAEIDARETSSPEDFRPVWQEARIAPCGLPKGVALRLRRLVAGLGLRYAAIDLRRRDDGEHVFLEANPSGQWLFVEERAGLPITAAVARLLAGR